MARPFHDRFQLARESTAKLKPVLGFEKSRPGWAAAAYLTTIQNAGSYFDLGKTTSNPQSHIKLPSDFVTAMAEAVACGILTEDGPKTGQYRFTHHRFEEYLAGWYLANNDVSVDWPTVLDQPRWQETILNLVSISGVCPAVEAIVNFLDSSQKELDASQQEGPLARASVERIVSSRLDLASRILKELGAEPSALDDSLRPPTIRGVAGLLEHGNPATQVNMLSSATHLRGLDYYAAARWALNSPVLWVRH